LIGKRRTPLTPRTTTSTKQTPPEGVMFSEGKARQHLGQLADYTEASWAGAERSQLVIISVAVPRDAVLAPIAPADRPARGATEAEEEGATVPATGEFSRASCEERKRSRSMTSSKRALFRASS
jgi:hypothetical protein